MFDLNRLQFNVFLTIVPTVLVWLMRSVWRVFGVFYIANVLDGLPNNQMFPLEMSQNVRSMSKDSKNIRREFENYFSNEGAVAWQLDRFSQHPTMLKID